MSTLEADFVGTSLGSCEAQLRMHSLISASVPAERIFVGGTSQDPVRRSFRAVLDIEGINASSTEQVFQSDFRDGIGDIQNAPTDHWPLVHFTVDSLKGTVVSGDIELRPLDRTVEALVLVTRLRYALNATGRCRLVEKPSNSVLLDMNVVRLADPDYKEVLLYAK